MVFGRWWRVFLVTVPLLSCRRTPTAAPSPSASASAAWVMPALDVASTDRAWVEARGGDPLELARLADVVGGPRLAEVADDPRAAPDDRDTAVRAAAFLDDPTPVLEVLAKLIREPGSDRSMLALQTVAAVAPRRRPIEEVEPTGWRAVGDAIVATLPATKAAERREVAIRALLGLVERGVVKREQVPER